MSDRETKQQMDQEDRHPIKNTQQVSSRMTIQWYEKSHPLDNSFVREDIVVAKDVRNRKLSSVVSLPEQPTTQEPVSGLPTESWRTTPSEQTSFKDAVFAHIYLCPAHLNQTLQKNLESEMEKTMLRIVYQEQCCQHVVFHVCSLQCKNHSQVSNDSVLMSLESLFHSACKI